MDSKNTQSITINKDLFTDGFLNPISRIADRGIIKVKVDSMECLSCSTYDKKEQTVILYSKCKAHNPSLSGDEVITLNVPDFKKLSNAINFITDDEITLQLDNNSITYENAGSDISFRYHLLDDGILEKPTVKMEIINALEMDFQCVVTLDSLDTIVKGTSFANQSNKIYLYTKDGKTMGMLTDQSISNIDSLSVMIANSFTGNELKKQLPLNLDIFKILSSLRVDEVRLKANTNRGILIFEVGNGSDYLLQYIVTAVVK